MESTRFEEFWTLNPTGSKEIVLAHYQGALYEHKVSEELLIEKMKAYMLMCKVQKTEAKYIKRPVNFLSDGYFLQSFQSSSGSTLFYIEKWLEGFL